jgi:ATP-dependent Zn protease
MFYLKFIFYNLYMKPNLTDNKLVDFFTNMNKNIHVKEINHNIHIKNTNTNTNMFFVNLIFICIILIFVYILYRRNKLKKYNKLVYENKIKNLYNNIINY